jgi:Mn2+/Fe2+ NRAMP family transporter
MGVLLTLIAGLVVWIVLWALGQRAFDAMLITMVMLVIAAAVRLVAPYLPGNRRDS